MPSKTFEEEKERHWPL